MFQQLFGLAFLMALFGYFIYAPIPFCNLIGRLPFILDG